MKILLDECLPVDLRHSFPGHEANTVEWAGFKGKKNGDLLRAAEIAGYTVLLTVDQGMPQQANAPGRKLAILFAGCAIESNGRLAAARPGRTGSVAIHSARSGHQARTLNGGWRRWRTLRVFPCGF